MITSQEEIRINQYIERHVVDRLVSHNLTLESSIGKTTVEIKMRIDFHVARDRPFAELIQQISHMRIGLGKMEVVINHRNQKDASPNNPYLARVEVEATQTDEESHIYLENELSMAIASLLDDLDKQLFLQKARYVNKCKGVTFTWVLLSSTLFLTHIVAAMYLTSMIDDTWKAFMINLILYIGIFATEGVMIREVINKPFIRYRKDLLFDIWDDRTNDI